jgi:hypothetical protein
MAIRNTAHGNLFAKLNYRKVDVFGRHRVSARESPTHAA